GGRRPGPGAGDPVTVDLHPSGADREVGGDERPGREDHRVSVILLRPRGASGSPPRATEVCSASSWNGRISSSGESSSGAPSGSVNPTAASATAAGWPTQKTSALSSASRGSTSPIA